MNRHGNTNHMIGGRRVAYDRGVALILQAEASPTRAAAHALAVPVALILVAVLSASLLA